MMCRPLRAVMVGRCYAIIVPEIRGVRSLIPGRGPVTWRTRRTFASPFLSLFLFCFCLTGGRAGGRGKGGWRGGRGREGGVEGAVRQDPSVCHPSVTGAGGGGGGRGAATRSADDTPACTPVVAARCPAALDPVGIALGSPPAYALALCHTRLRIVGGGRESIARAGLPVEGGGWEGAGGRHLSRVPRARGSARSERSSSHSRADSAGHPLRCRSGSDREDRSRRCAAVPGAMTNVAAGREGGRKKLGDTRARVRYLSRHTLAMRLIATASPLG
jgi:hypothetical protein